MKVTTDSCLFGAWVAADLKESFQAAPSAKARALDIGAGTGLLSLMIAQQAALPIDAVEVDEAASLQAKENIHASPWCSHIQIAHADIRKFDKSGYDVIVSNPPFYEDALASPDSAKNMAHHSSVLTLKNLVGLIAEKIHAQGMFYLLLPFSRRAEIKNMLQQNNLYTTALVYVAPDRQHPFSRVMIKGSAERAAGAASFEMYIRNEDGQYTEEFIRLLSPYYLYL